MRLAAVPWCRQRCASFPYARVLRSALWTLTFCSSTINFNKAAGGAGAGAGAGACFYAFSIYHFALFIHQQSTLEGDINVTGRPRVHWLGEPL